jgi:hypothetical protein
MITNVLERSSDCPLGDEFNIPDIVGALQKKQWLFGARVADVGAITYLTLSGGIVKRLYGNVQILAQKLNVAPSNKTFASAKGTNGFTLNGDSGGAYSIVILGTEPATDPPGGKWAKDYCPFCKSQGYPAILGSSLKEQVAFAFLHTLGSGADVISFATDTKPYTMLGLPRGLKKASLVTQMADDDYQIIITKVSDDGTTAPYPTLITPTGFTLNGDQNSLYDIFILGSILY